MNNSGVWIRNLLLAVEQQQTAMAANRSLYIHGIDQASSTYITNYIVAGICFLGVILHLLPPTCPKPRPGPLPPASNAWGRYLTPSVFLLLHLFLYGITFLIAGLDHQFFHYRICPGTEILDDGTAVSVACPTENGEPVDTPTNQVFLFFYGLSAWQLLPVSSSLSGIMGSKCFCGGNDDDSGGGNIKAKKCHISIVIISEIAALASGVYGAAETDFTTLGTISAALYIVFAASLVVGLCCKPAKGTLVGGKILALFGAITTLVGFGIQQLLKPSCGYDAYQENGAADCPLPGDGVTGFNHNALYHVLEITAKILLVFAARWLVVDLHADGETNAPNTSSIEVGGEDKKETPDRTNVKDVGNRDIEPA